MAALPRTRTRTRRKLFLFCPHPIAQERFTRLLRRTEFEVVLSPEFRLPQDAAAALDTTEMAVKLRVHRAYEALRAALHSCK